MRVDEMPAGREMDALVNKVLGNEVRYGCFVSDWHNDSCVGPENAADCLIAKEKIKRGEEIPRDCEYWKAVDPPPYSTDLAAAWEVVNRMKNYFFVCGRTDEGRWEAIFYPVNSGVGKLSEGRGDTVSLAICRAILKAMGVEEC